MADIVPAWMWRDPEEIIEPLLRIAAKKEERAQAPAAEPAGVSGARDRYYTMARRIHVKQLMRSGR
jgi:hypothetical protein